MLNSPWIYVIIAAVFFGAGMKVENWRQGASEARTEAKQDTANAQATTKEFALVGQEQAALTPIFKSNLEAAKDWSTYVAKNPNTDCKLPADLIRLRSAAASLRPAGSGSADGSGRSAAP